MKNVGDKVLIPTGPATYEVYTVASVHPDSHIVVARPEDGKELFGMPAPSWEKEDVWCFAPTLMETKSAVENWKFLNSVPGIERIKRPLDKAEDRT